MLFSWRSIKIMLFSWRIWCYPCWLRWLMSSICRPRSLRTGTLRKLASKTCSWAHREVNGRRRTFSSVPYGLNNYSLRGRQFPGTRMTQRSLQSWLPNTTVSKRMLPSKNGRYHLMPIKPSMASSWGWQANQEHWFVHIWITTSGKNQVTWIITTISILPQGFSKGWFLILVDFRKWNEQLCEDTTRASCVWRGISWTKPQKDVNHFGSSCSQFLGFILTLHPSIIA